jgi:hypothetical protein
MSISPPETEKMPVFNLGEPLHEHEVVAVYERVFEHQPPHNLDRRTLPTAILAYVSKLRFEFEVNRLRGHAFDYDELVSA